MVCDFKLARGGGGSTVGLDMIDFIHNGFNHFNCVSFL